MDNACHSMGVFERVLSMMNKVFFTAVASLTALGAVLGNAAAASLEEIQERGVLRVAVASLSPFVIKDKDGNFTGFEIDATALLAESLGVDVEYVEKPFCELVDAVIEDEADMIASGFSNTPARRRVLDFSLPYHDTEYFLVIDKRKIKDAKTLRGLNRSDVTIGYQEGGVSGDVATGDFAGASLESFSSFAEIIAALKAGEIDGAVMFAPYQDIARKIKRYDYTVPHRNALTRTIEAYAIEKGNEDLRNALNGWVIERDLEDYWDDLEEKWFDPDNASVGKRPPYECPAKVPTG